MGILKVVLIVLTIACLTAGFAPMGVSARLEARWALQMGDITTGDDISI